MNNIPILVIDDEPQIRKLLEITLSSHDYSVQVAETAAEGILIAANHPPELILLDLGLPDKNGQQVLKELREWYSNAIIILSVQNNEESIVKALDNGANDYLAKPFRTAELMARIRSALRNNLNNSINPIEKIEDLEIDLAARVVKKNGENLKFTSTEFILLALFVKHRGSVLTHQFILKEIWGVAYQTETQYLRVFVGNLRKKIEKNPNQPKILITESGVGYRLM